MIRQFLRAAQQGTKVNTLRRRGDLEVLGQLILDVLDGSPRVHRERTLTAVCVVDILDEDLEVGGGVEGEAIVMTHDYDGNDEIGHLAKEGGAPRLGELELRMTR